MTIKRRLFLSNVLMIVVPALVTALTGLLCMVMVVSVLRQGSGLGYEEGGELAWIGRQRYAAGADGGRQACLHLRHRAGG